MGWHGYGIYSGDETQTLHIDFMKRLGFSYEDIEPCLKVGKTSLTEEMIEKICTDGHLIIDKMPKLVTPNIYFTSDEAALEWQMLLALFIDNDIFSYDCDDVFERVCHEVFKVGILATTYLSYQHASEFDYPKKRRAVLKRFSQKATKQYAEWM